MVFDDIYRVTGRLEPTSASEIAEADRGRLLINIGPAPKRLGRGPFYATEIEEVARRGYSNIINVPWP